MNRRYALRYLSVVLLFSMIGVAFLGRLFYIMIAGRSAVYEDTENVEYVTLQAVRGEIYDRDGEKLVANRYTYDIVLTYSAFSGLSTQEKNEVCLALATSLQDCGAESLHTEAYFPFAGAYPNYTYTPAARDEGTAVGYRLKNYVCDVLGLSGSAAASEVRDALVKKYELKAMVAETPKYTDAQIDTILRLHYDMLACRFFYNGEYLFARGVSESDALTKDLMTNVAEKNLVSVSTKRNIVREYCHPGYASHILGSIGPIYAEEWSYYEALGYQMADLVGKDGCEAAFEHYLRGVSGIQRIEKKADGTVEITTLREPIAGRDVYLTIDIDLQKAAEDGLADNVQYVVENSNGYKSAGASCDAGAAVVMDPETFEILAVASYPTYDLSTFNNDYASLLLDPAEPLRNRALNEGYAPGSTLKLGMGAIGLSEGVISRDYQYFCKHFYYGDGFECSTWGENHTGNQNVVEAIVHSCNSFFYELGDLLGIDRMEEYLARLGLGERTGLELGGVEGILAGPTYRGEGQSDDQWQPGMTWSAAIGQSDTRMSPMQLAAYMGTLCNGGTRYATRLLHSVRTYGDTGGDGVLMGTSEILSYAGLTASSLETIYDGMEQMAQTNPVRTHLGLSKLPSYVTVGGKTGTAQVDGHDADGDPNPENALFVCSATTDGEDTPDLVIAVVLEAGAHGYFAARTAGTILDQYYNKTPVSH